MAVVTADYVRAVPNRLADGSAHDLQLWRRRLCRIWRATAIQPSGDLTQEWVSVRFGARPVARKVDLALGSR